MKRIFGAILLSLWAAVAVAQMPPKPGPKDTCPVCGMLVSKYPNWVATIVYKDGHAHHFDGAKDMFKFWFDPPKYVAGHSQKMITAIWVTEYYGLRKIDARKAWYVIGSDVLGPMGHEFVPLANQADADDFLREHKGKRMLRFDEVSAAMTLDLDEGRF
ncbi:MAG: nitrous oxide reductase accessory protein NosL [Gammaproteobacteria bacterium]|nr:nitrous oxide reductase accessory protein NosL [Gammaproteobacteria bacterium]MBU1416182.1 nitrous oxide reductase accessory protein NosL [Gammaproteobacteria bacterium]